MTRATLLVFLLGCGGSEDQKSETADTGSGPTYATDRPNGDYLLGFSIAAVGGLTIPFQATVESLEDGESGQIMSSFSLRATDGAELVSEDLATVTDLAYDPNGGVTVDLGTFMLPGEFSPTGGEVELQVVLGLTASSADGFCGDVTGQILTFGLDLAESTFAATPWEDRAEGASTACDAPTEALERMDVADCPALLAGANTGFVSAGLERSFVVTLPADYSADRDWPVIFAYHGFGGSGQSLLDVGLSAWADAGSAILIAPDAADRGGEPAWDVFNDESSNTDLVFFDDLLTCAANSFSVDETRVYATGMSNGGLFTGLLLGQRSQTLAAAAPLSGGLLGELAEDFEAPPVQVLWGGEADEAYEVDFDATSRELIELLRANGGFVVSCEHDLGHELEASFWDFTVPFLLAHTSVDAALPFAEGLSESFPDWCWIEE